MHEAALFSPGFPQSVFVGPWLEVFVGRGTSTTSVWRDLTSLFGNLVAVEWLAAQETYRLMECDVDGEVVVCQARLPG